jgi:hypothetical protein
MLIRISLIVALVIGVAGVVANFVYVRPKLIELRNHDAEETKLHQEFEGKYNTTKKELTKTTTELNQTKATLEAATAAKDKAEADLLAQTKRADKLNEDLTKTRQDLDTAQAELAAYKATGRTPQAILGMNQEIRKVQENLAAVEIENKILTQDLKKTKNELAVFKDPNLEIMLPAKLKGKVLVADPKWNFVVLNVGEDQGVLERGELLVNRNGKLVAKVVVRSVQKDRCIANVQPGWELGEVMEGDLVIPAHPAS